ncbi:phage tail tape measure protein, partial [Streptomyces sp. CC53]|uniref:phage tail tape measure protein n=1 Tax=Streptomyces sp. CC53 TaxID=1906740 RepID=UPI000A98A60E
MALLDELLIRIGMDSTGVDQGTQEVQGRLDGLAAPAAAAGGLAGAVFVAGITQAMDIASAQHKLQNQLGLTAEEAERAGDVAGEVFSAGFGQSLGDVNAALGGIHSGIGDLGEFTEAELQDMSKQALALADTFETDVADATGAVGQLIKTGLAADATEGFDLVTKAMQTIPAELRGDLLPTIQEYSTQFRRIGLDGQTSMGLLQQAVQAGARDLDQVADGIGQFGEITLAGSDAAKEAFKSIGLNGTEMAKLMGRGGASAQKALQMTMDALRGTENETTKLNAAAALFGDPANVMGEALFALDPATAAASTGMNQAAGAAKGLAGSMEADPAQQMDAAMRQLMMTLGEALLPIVKSVSEFMSENKEIMQIAVPVVLGLVAALAVMAVVIWAVNAAMYANP